MGKVTCFLLCGLPGAGKSTWCKTYWAGVPVVSRDITRAELGYTKNADDKAVLDRATENLITEVNQKKMENLITLHQDFIVDDMNGNPTYRVPLIQWLHERNVTVVGVNFNTPLEVCIQRRVGQIPEDVMVKIASRFQPFGPEDVDELKLVAY